MKLPRHALTKFVYKRNNIVIAVNKNVCFPFIFLYSTLVRAIPVG